MSSRAARVPTLTSPGGATARAARVAVEAAVTATHDRPPVPARLTTFLDLSAQIFCITDFTSVLVWWNPAFERTLGYDPGELCTLRLDDLVHPDDRAVRQAAEAVLAKEGEAGLTQVRFSATASGAGSNGRPASISTVDASTAPHATSPTGAGTRWR